MPAKKECPFTVDELREMYEVQGMTSYDIADKGRCSQVTALRWLRHANIELKPSAAYANLIAEKPSEIWLREAYWQLGLSLAEVGQKWSKAIGRQHAVNERTVGLWMDSFRIPRRPKFVGIVRRSKTKKAKEITRQLGRKGNSSYTFFDPVKQKDAAMKGLAVRRKNASKPETRSCCLKGCVNKTTRISRRFNGPVWFCSKSCALKFYHEQQRQQAHDAKLEAMKQEADAVLERAAEEARAILRSYSPNR